jgi:hypothetical protein
MLGQSQGGTRGKIAAGKQTRRRQNARAGLPRSKLPGGSCMQYPPKRGNAQHKTHGNERSYGHPFLLLSYRTWTDFQGNSSTEIRIRVRVGGED